LLSANASHRDVIHDTCNVPVLINYEFLQELI
jgi:hypothetical protein